MERHQDSFSSRILERPVEYLWFGHSGRPLVTFPTASGRYWENEDFHLVNCVKDKIERGELQVCCIDAYSDDTWNNSAIHPAERVARHDRIDAMWAEALFPMVAARAGRGDTIVYGASMGGFHAVNFAARHPEQVGRCIAFSGMFDTRRLLDGHWDEQAYFHCPTCYVPNMDDEWCARMRTVEWVLATGETDSIVHETREFSDILRHKEIPVHSEIWPGVFGHDWPYWREHLPRFVP
ncbi:MAG: alpha/beta hydrolase-fold protein [Planctomycetota bacterium]|jgi:esterase/lipase superfamily enzyme